MATRAHVEIDRARIKELTERESAKLDARTQGSRDFYARAQKSLAGGVASSYQSRDPWPIYLSHGKGAQVWDVDGNEYLDFHNGFGSMVQGHAHDVISKAVTDRIGLGTHFAAPTEDSIVVGEELARRWGLEHWRYVNSGSEATMDAIRIARGVTGRDTIVKIFGSYHGHHDYVMVSLGVDYDSIGDRFDLQSIPYGLGIPQVVADMTIAVPFNDAEAMERRIERLIDEDRKPACVIMEAAMMNLGVVLPEPGYLEAVREITQKHGILLIFDEVKTGLCIAAGGAVEKYGVVPDMVTLAKALGGGLPSRRDRWHDGGVREGRSRGEIVQVGTYNGNPLVDGGGTGEPARGDDTGRVRPPRRAQRAHPRRLPGGDREVRVPGLLGRRRLEGVRHVLAREDHGLRVVQGEPGRGALLPRVALQHEPRHLHDAGSRGGVDALDHAHDRGLQHVRGGV